MIRQNILTLALLGFATMPVAYAEASLADKAAAQAKVIEEVATELKLISDKTPPADLALLKQALNPRAPLDLMTRLLVVAAVSDENMVGAAKLREMWEKIDSSHAFNQDIEWLDFKKDFTEAIFKLLYNADYPKNKKEPGLKSIVVQGSIDHSRDITVNFASNVESWVRKGRVDEKGNKLQKYFKVSADGHKQVTYTVVRDRHLGSQRVAAFKAVSDAYKDAVKDPRSAPKAAVVLVDILENTPADDADYIVFQRSGEGWIGVNSSGFNISVDALTLVIPTKRKGGMMAALPLLDQKNSYTEGAAAATHVPSDIGSDK